MRFQKNRINRPDFFSKKKAGNVRNMKANPGAAKSTAAHHGHPHACHAPKKTPTLIAIANRHVIAKNKIPIAHPAPHCRAIPM
jgi:hypothetical protein